MFKGHSRPAGAAVRERLAQEAARLMIEHGIADYRLAKRKAAERFAVSGTRMLPSNAQIEACLAERQRIFAPDVQSGRVDVLRRVAVDAMEVLALFEPRLVGPVLSGTATIASPIELHLFADAPESVAGLLARAGIDYEETQRRYRFSGGRIALVPGFGFSRAGERILLIVFAEKGLREAPLSPVDRRPMERAAQSRVRALLAD